MEEPGKEDAMRIAAMQVELHAFWVHSLKEKRMEVRSLEAKLRNKFNVSVAEVAEQDIHQRIALGIAAIAADSAQADSILDHVLNFIEDNTEAQVLSVERIFY